MRAWMCRGPVAVFYLFLALASPQQTRAQDLEEVGPLDVDPSGALSWPAVAGADHYNFYLSRSTEDGSLRNPRCSQYALTTTGLASTPDPAPGEVLGFVITAESQTLGEGPPGNTSAGSPRYLSGACTPLLQNHIFTRTGYGSDDWVRGRMEALGGFQGYLDEQLDPASISEADNFFLNNRLITYEPPLDGIDLIARHTLHAVYARRQLEHRMAMFWVNHFNTDWEKVAEYFMELFPDCAVSTDPWCDEIFPYQGYLRATNSQLFDFEKFRHLAFNGNFRQMLEAGSLSAAMLVYLDLHTSTAGNPNENQPREALELHSMGVHGGYTQQDVEELSRVMTGWGLCKKTVAHQGDPLAPCVDDYWDASIQGEWTAHFDLSRHDCNAKTLFQGTPQEVTLPGTSNCKSAANAQVAIDELGQAFDAIAAHPSTPRFISRKILQLLVTDDPTPAMEDTLIAAWNDPGNPHGVGDLREVTRAALNMEPFLDPARVADKIKTPFEHFAGSIRSLRGTTDGISVILNALNSSRHLPFFFTVPTGYAEVGDEWMSTGNTLVRQNWGVDLATTPLGFPGFGSQPLTLLAENGISTAPGNAEAIVDFFSMALFGGRLSYSERQIAIDFLNTNTLGNPSPYDDQRILETVGLMLGFPHYQEQ